MIDGTFGGGGHTHALLEAAAPDGRVLALDADPDAIARGQSLRAEFGERLTLRQANFAAMVEVAAAIGWSTGSVDSIILDLGLSTYQLRDAERGFSFASDGPLDMRFDTTQGRTAAEIVNTWDARRLARLIRSHGEERYATPIARAIVRARHDGPIDTTQELVDVIKAAIPAPARFAGGHPAKRTFQALRIQVNDELGQLDAGLPLAWEVLAPDGRLAAISFHSLEDRRVKRFLADRAKGCICPPDLPVCGCGREPEAELLTRKAIAPTPGEVEANPRSKSAHLRAAKRI